MELRALHDKLLYSGTFVASIVKLNSEAHLCRDGGLGEKVLGGCDAGFD